MAFIWIEVFSRSLPKSIANLVAYYLEVRRMSLLGGLLELPGKLIGQSLKALTGQSQTEKKPAPPPPSRIRDNVNFSDEMAETMSPQAMNVANGARANLGSGNDLDSLQAPLAPMFGMNQGRYDYNPQAARVQKLFESQMIDFGPPL